MYEYAKAYYEEYGHLDVPKRYTTIDGYSLGSWLLTQRRVYAGEVLGRLSNEQVQQLNDIGMRWDKKSEITWKQGYAELVKYKEEHGDLDIPSQYITKDGFQLGSLVGNIRYASAYGTRSTFLTPEHEAMLTELGFIWDKLDYVWEQNYLACMKFKLENGHLNIPSDAVSEEGLAIGAWIRRMRKIRIGKVVGRLTDSQINKLDEIGFSWEDHFTKQWNDAFARLLIYKEENGHVNVPTMYIDEAGFALGRWLKRQQDNKKLEEEKKKKLLEIGVSFEKTPDSWEVRYALAAVYYREHGDLNIPPAYKADGIWISKWLNEQRQIYIGNRKGKKLSEEQIDRLNTIGMVWESLTQLNKETVWMEQYDEAKQFFLENGHLSIPRGYRTQSGKQLSVWLLRQRKAYSEGKLSDDKIGLLKDLGMVFELDDPWEVGFTHAEEYVAMFGNLDIPGNYVCTDGYNLGGWITNQRSNHNNPTKYHYLTAEQSERLEKLGIIWNPTKEKWLEGFQHACEYAKLLNGSKWLSTYISPDGYQTGQWLRNQKRRSLKNQLDDDKSAMLAEIGFVFGD